MRKLFFVVVAVVLVALVACSWLKSKKVADAKSATVEQQQ